MLLCNIFAIVALISAIATKILDDKLIKALEKKTQAADDLITALKKEIESHKNLEKSQEELIAALRTKIEMTARKE